MRRVSRRWLLCLAIAAAGCGLLPRRPLIPVPPEVLPDTDWRRIGLETPPLDQSPEMLRRLGVGQWVRTSYRRAGASVLVDSYAMNSQASAFEAQQKWRNEPGAVTFAKGSIFVVCSSPTEPTQSLVAFSRLLEDAWLGTAR